MKVRYIVVSAALFVGVLGYIYLPSVLTPIRPLPAMPGRIGRDTLDRAFHTVREHVSIPEAEINLADRCGTAPESHRTLVAGGTDFSDEKSINLSPIHLIGTFGGPGRSEIVVRLIISKGKGINYVSRDHGETWTRAGWDQIGTQYQFRRSPMGWTNCTISRADSNVIYDIASGPHNGDFHISLDQGKTWRTVHPKLEGGRHLGKCMIFDTGLRDPARVYAEISAPYVYGIGVSTDYGSTFKILSYRQFESRANPTAIFRVFSDQSSDRGVRLSSFPGSVGIRLDGMASFFDGLFADPSHPELIRTWQITALYPELPAREPVEEIETDPHDEKIFYAFNQFRGIVKTVDGGHTSSLLPLALDKYLEIESFAVDPAQGNYLYAVLTSRALYRSADYGCSWQKIRFP